MAVPLSSGFVLLLLATGCWAMRTQQHDIARVGDPLVQMGNGMDKIFFCCAVKDGTEYGFMKMKNGERVLEAELGAIEFLKQKGIDPSYLMETHRVDEVPPFLPLPDNLVGRNGADPVSTANLVGYWVKRSHFVMDFKPKMFSMFGVSAKVSRNMKKLKKAAEEHGGPANWEETKALAKAGLNYLKDHVEAICSAVGEVSVFIESDGHVLLSDVAPNESGDTCLVESAIIRAGFINVEREVARR